MHAPHKSVAFAGVEYAGRRYVRAPEPVYFPVEEEVGESKRHLRQRTVLYQLLELELSSRAAIGSDQFVYWDPTDPRQCLSPDVFVRLGVPDDDFKSWKVWERGAPHVAVEVISDSDDRDRDWDAKLVRYRRMGVSELIRFDHADRDRPLRIWDLVEGDLVERVLARRRFGDCLPLKLVWVVLESETGRVLRLARDAEGVDLLPTEAERERAEAERARAEAERARAEQELRIAALEAELRRQNRS